MGREAIEDAIDETDVDLLDVTGPPEVFSLVQRETGDAAGYHAYAFATVRMAGAGFELCASHVDWLLGARGARACAALGRIVDASKLLGFKLARRRPFDPQPALDVLAEAWDEALLELDDAVG